MSEKLEDVLNSVLIDGEDDGFSDIEGETIKDSLREYSNKLILEI